MYGARKQLKKRMADSFGKNPMKDYLFFGAEHRLDKIRRYHDHKKSPEKGSWQVDDITWEDLRRLKEIILYRKMDVSIETIEQILERKVVLQEALEKQIRELEEKRRTIEESMDLCKKMMEDRPRESFDIDFYLEYVKEEESNGTQFARIGVMETACRYFG